MAGAQWCWGDWVPAHWKGLMHHSCESLAEDRSQGAATPSTSAGPKNGKSPTITTGSPWAEKCRCWCLVCTDTGRMMVGHLQQNFTSLHCQGKMGSVSLMVFPHWTVPGTSIWYPCPNFPRTPQLPGLEQWELTGCFYPWTARRL